MKEGKKLIKKDYEIAIKILNKNVNGILRYEK